MQWQRVSEWAGNPCGVRVAFICIYVLCQLISSFCRRQQNKISVSDKPLLDKTCCYLSVCLPHCLAATRHVLAGGVQVHFAATTARTKRADASFILAQLGAVSHMHTICILISLEWFRQQKTPTNSQSVRGDFSSPSPPTLFCLSATPACIFFLSTCQSVFIIIAAISVSCAASICQLVSLSVRLSVCLYFYLASQSLPLPPPHSFYSSQCSAFKLQPIVIAAFVLPSKSFVQVMQPFFQLINLFSYICCLPPAPTPSAVPLSFFYLPGRLLSMSTGAAATAAAAFVCSRSASLGLMNN